MPTSIPSSRAARRAETKAAAISPVVRPPTARRVNASCDGADSDGWQRYPECVADQPITPIADEIEGDLLQYSSGTTGRPKGIQRELRHIAPAEAAAPLAAIVAFWANPDAIYLSPAPLYHTAPNVWSMSMQAAGIPVVVLERFDAEGALEAIARHRVTHGQFVPVMFTRMLKLPEAVRNSYDVSSLQRVIHAAAPCPIDVKKQMIDWWGPIVDEYYASSEGHGFTLIGAQDWLAHPGSVGQSIIGTVHILDEGGNELPAGEAGEIYFESDVQFEYLNDPEKTAASTSRHGWRTVGDIGYVDDDGFLYLTDRRHHMIISGGVNIYPAEIEAELLKMPGVADCAVFGIPDAEFGESLMAAVERAPGATVDAAARQEPEEAATPGVRASKRKGGSVPAPGAGRSWWTWPAQRGKRAPV